MSLFSKQEVFCQGCGGEFETTFHEYGGKVCSQECFDVIQRKKAFSILGKEYYPKEKD